MQKSTFHQYQGKNIGTAFDLHDSFTNYLNQHCTIYQEIAKIAKINQSYEPLRFGRMYFREISGNGYDFGLPQGHPCTLAFSRILGGEEILIAYNTSTEHKRSDFVIVDSSIQKSGKTMKYLYGKDGTVNIQTHPDSNNPTLFIQLDLEPMQFVILK